MPVRAATVTTLRNAGPIKSFVAYHLAMGFEHMFLFFDDPNDPDLAWARTQGKVTAIPHNSALRQKWAQMLNFMQHINFIDKEVQARQILNAEVAMGLARDKGIDWLLHIDADELFYPREGDAASHFAKVDRSPFDTVCYLNYEAISESEETVDFFREVTLFKRAHDMCPPSTPEADQLIASTSQLSPSFFHYYDAGKEAVRLKSQGMLPRSPHHFIRPEPERFFKGTSPEDVILHYACCGFETLWQKYVTLGNFADKWWDKVDIAGVHMGFHLQARDAVMTGDRDYARRFYRERLMIDDPDLIAELQRHGLVERVTRPKDLLTSLLGNVEPLRHAGEGVRA